MNIFLRHRIQFGLDLNMKRFLMRLTLPTSHPNSIHPSLLNAMYLIACLYSPTPEVVALQSRFFAQVRFHLPQALAQVDRLFDYLIATCLLARHYFHQARLLEAHQTIQAAARFSLACGMHKIRTRSVEATASDPDLASSLLGPPADTIELGERINIFWVIFVMDRMNSLTMNLPHTFSDEV